MNTDSTGAQTLQEIWVGLDLAKATFEAAIFLQSDKTKGEQFPTTQAGVKRLLEWCDGQLKQRNLEGRLRFVMEATSSYSLRVFSWLYELRPDSAPAIINPHYIKCFGQSLGSRNKTDKADATVIARFGHERRPAGETPKKPEQERLQRLVRERQTRVEEMTAAKNRMSEPCDMPEICKLRKQHIELLKKHISTIERFIQQLVKETPDLKRDVQLLESVPGVGFIVATTILAELGDLRRFEDPKKLVAFCGMSPRQFTSGSSINRPTRLSKMGNKRVRPLLHLAARSLVGRTKYAYGKWYEDLVASGKKPRSALAAVARKILVMMRAVLVSGKPYSNEIAGCGKHITTLVKNNTQSALAA